MSLWDWAGAAYARPGVEGLCLSLQDDHGQCAPYLIWAAWEANRGAATDMARLAAAATLARDWDKAVIAPLRSARRALKAPAPGVGPDARERLRGRVKAAELTAERLLLDALEAHTPDPAGAPRDPRPALRAASAAWSSDPAPAALLEALGQAFSIA